MLRDSPSGRWSGAGEGGHPCALIQIDARIIVQPRPELLSCEAVIAMTAAGRLTVVHGVSCATIYSIMLFATVVATEPCRLSNVIERIS